MDLRSRVLLLDGAMGSRLWRPGLGCVERLVLEDPEAVRRIHLEHVAAGAEVLTACTFQANPVTLGLEGARIVSRAVAIARECAEGRPVLASVGPVADAEVLAGALAWCAEADGVLLETWSSPLVFAWLAKMRWTKPLMLSLAFQHDAAGRIVSHSGHTPEELARLASGLPLAAFGANCGREITPGDLCEILRRFRQETELPLLVRANAGTPGPDGSYPVTAEAMAREVLAWVAAGARLVGGCCGTTGEHLRAMWGRFCELGLVEESP